MGTWMIRAAAMVLLVWNAQAAAEIEGLWRAALQSPGGEIPFGLEIARKADSEALEGWIRNGEERRRIGEVSLSDGVLELNLVPYDSRIRARLSEDGKQLSGEWRRYRGPQRETRMIFSATLGESRRFPDVKPAAEEIHEITGRWAVTFSSSDDVAVGLFDRLNGDRVQGTFLTTLGDYRFLAGAYDGENLSLSCFDGAHAFLFKARYMDSGRMEGDFWSRDSWHETWTAQRDESVELPNGFGLTTQVEGMNVNDLSFPDLDGNMRSLGEGLFAGRARLIVIFGTWCPNCYDATTYLAELYRRYTTRGLAVQGLAFEFGNTQERNARVVREYVDHKNIPYPVLLAGPSDKDEASKAFPVLDKVRAYPTFLFLDGEGSIQAIYTGFSGPATGTAHEKLRDAFETRIEELLER